MVDERDYDVFVANETSSEEADVIVIFDGNYVADAEFAYFVDYALVDGGYEVTLFMDSEEVTYFADEDDVTTGDFPSDEDWVEVEFEGGDIVDVDSLSGDFTLETDLFVESATSTKIKVWDEWTDENGFYDGYDYYYFEDDAMVIYDNGDDDAEIYAIDDLGKYQEVELLFNSDDELVGIVIVDLDVTD